MSSRGSSPRRGRSPSNASSTHADLSTSLLSVDMDDIENSVRHSKSIEDFTNIITEFRMNRQTLYPDSLAGELLPRIPPSTSEPGGLSASTSRQSMDAGETSRCTCCCGQDDCSKALRARQEWRDLEADLRLSAEIGQALLRRHDAMQAKLQKQAQEYMQQRDGLMSRLTKSYKETSGLERELAQANLNLEAGDSSNRALLQELEETRAQLSKAKAGQSKWSSAEARAETLTREIEDLKQELAAEQKRATSAEARCKKLESKADQLSDTLKSARDHVVPLPASPVFDEDALRSARSRLSPAPQQHTRAFSETDPVHTQSDATLIKDNEALRADNAQLRALLDTCNEELALLRATSSNGESKYTKREADVSLLSELNFKGSDSDRPNIVRGDSVATSGSLTSQGPASSMLANSSQSSETSREIERVTDLAATRESRTAQLGSLLDYVVRIFGRLSTADVDTLSKRLQRQHLAGDAGHLARTTVQSILREVDGLREHFRKRIEQESRTRDDASSHEVTSESLVARKEFFALLKVFRDILAEMAKLRLCINEIHLSPNNAAKLLHEHLGASAAEDRSLIAIPSAVNWLGKMLLGGPSAGTPAALPPAGKERSSARLVSASHLAPRASAAVVSSTLAVEVKGLHASAAEGTKPGALRAHTSPAGSNIGSNTLQAGPRPLAGRSATSLSRVQSKNLSGLFAGGMGASYQQLPIRNPTMARRQRPMSRIMDDDEVSVHRGRAIRQQVFDDSSEEDSDGESRLLDRVLRPRGLSDSSIRSTFIEHGETLSGARTSRSVTPASLSVQHPDADVGSGASSGSLTPGCVGNNTPSRSDKVLSFLSGGIVGSSAAPSHSTLSVAGPQLRASTSITSLNKAAARGTVVQAKEAPASKAQISTTEEATSKDGSGKAHTGLGLGLPRLSAGGGRTGF